MTSMIVVFDGLDEGKKHTSSGGAEEEEEEEVGREEPHVGWVCWCGYFQATGRGHGF